MSELPLVKDYMSPSFVTIAADESLTRAKGVFETEHPPLIVVVEGEKFFGIITERVLLKPRLNPLVVKAASVALRPPKLSPDDNVCKAARLMIENSLKAIPVLQDEKVVGILTVRDVVSSCSRFLRGIKVREVMTRDPVVINVDDTIGKAVSVMRDMGVSRLPVVENGELRGILTLHDLITKIILPREKSSIGDMMGEKIRTLSNRVRDIMTVPVHTAYPWEPVQRALDRMEQYDISSLVVVEDRKVVGILTLIDILAPIARLGSQFVEDIDVQVIYKLGSIDTSSKERVSLMSRRFINRLRKTIGKGVLTLHFKEHKEKHGERHLIHCRARLKTDKYQFVGVGEGWTPDLAARTALDRIERQIIMSKELAMRYPYGVEIIERLAETY
ncbi:MAG: CBS domain-containing protein [Nitrososphaerota archaeon]